VLCENVTEAKDGVYAAGCSVGYWFVKKGEVAACLTKKFYVFMHKKRLVSKECPGDSEEVIKQDMSCFIP